MQTFLTMGIFQFTGIFFCRKMPVITDKNELMKTHHFKIHYPNVKLKNVVVSASSPFGVLKSPDRLSISKGGDIGS